MDDVRAISRAPRPTGSAENARVRAYLIARLRGLGLETRVQTAVARPGRWARETYGDRVELHNIVAVLPGRDRGLPALLIMAHHDSVRRSPGAADDGAGVAAALESARALSAGLRPARDVIVLLTDGEEIGLLGAKAFFDPSAPDPLARRVGLVLNMEARGGGGRAQMFETGRGNGDLARVLAREARSPSANSLAVFIYSVMPNGTDFSIPADRGLPGLNWAFIGRPGQYHQPSSTPENLDQGSLQHLGDQVLPTARALAASSDLPARTPDAVYADLFGLTMLVYPAWGGWLVLAGTLSLAAVAWRRPPPLRDASKGAAAAVGFVVLTALLLRGAALAAGFLPLQEVLDAFPAYELVLALLTTAVVLTVFASLRRGGRPPSAGGLWFGFILVGLLLSTALQVLAPTTAHTAAWPTLLACAAAAFAARRPESRLGLLAVTLAGALSLGLMGALWHGIALAVGTWAPEPLALLALLALLPLVPLLAGGPSAARSGSSGPPPGSARPRRT